MNNNGTIFTIPVNETLRNLILGGVSLDTLINKPLIYRDDNNTSKTLGIIKKVSTDFLYIDVIDMETVKKLGIGEPLTVRSSMEIRSIFDDESRLY